MRVVLGIGFLLAASVALVTAQQRSFRPTVGVLALSPDNCPSTGSNDTNFGGCFGTLYVKWLEAAGLLVAPIAYNIGDKELDYLMSSLNGVLFTGGDLYLTPNTTYYQTSRKIFDKVKKMNDAGTHFPLWGTCQGFQLLHLLAANDDLSVLEINAYDSEDYYIPLNFSSYAVSSRMLGNVPGTKEPNEVRVILGTLPSTTNLHHNGVPSTAYTANPALGAFFNIISNNVDRKGKEFVSTSEAKDYPIYAVQWHPERVSYDWSITHNHGLRAVRAMDYVARFFSAEARKNTQQFATQAEANRNSVYRYYPLYFSRKSDLATGQVIMLNNYDPLHD